jgi:tRNA dimethylallyltransferase
MQVYRKMDIGTAKPDPETRRLIKHHMIDVVDPTENMSVAEFQSVGCEAISTAEADGTQVVIAGGSGLHFRSLVDPLVFPGTDPTVRSAVEATSLEGLVAELIAADPGAAELVDLRNPRRVCRAVEVLRLTGLTPSGRYETPEAVAVRDYAPVVPTVIIGVDPGPEIARRVVERCDVMFASGILDEVRSLFGHVGRTAAQAVGYKELFPVVSGEISEEEGRSAVVRATLSLVKRQRTYFRRDPRVRWLAWHNDPDIRWQAMTELLESTE